MSVEDHLYIFGGIRGVHGSRLKGVVVVIIIAVVVVNVIIVFVVMVVFVFVFL